MKLAASNATAARRAGSHHPEQTRDAILHAAMREFAANGIAGARTEAIARAAGVNKALLYYYFKNKQTLYGAVLDDVFGGLKRSIDAALDRDLPPRDKLLAYVAAHFDYISRSRMTPQVVMREMMRDGRSPQIQHIAQAYLAPIFARVAQVLREGIAAGDFRPVDPVQFIPSMVALVVFYFTTSPVMRVVSGIDPLEPRRVVARRAAVLDFVSAALFTSRNAKELDCEWPS
jgi:TetR/AcrR family transcriptional regulator